MKQYVLSSIFGLATTDVIKKQDGTYTLLIGLQPKGAPKITQYLTQAGFKRKKDALKSLEDLQTYIEIKLHDEILKMNGVI